MKDGEKVLRVESILSVGNVSGRQSGMLFAIFLFFLFLKRKTRELANSLLILLHQELKHAIDTQPHTKLHART